MSQVGKQPHAPEIPAPQPAVTLLYTAQGTPVQVINVNQSDRTFHSYNAPAAKILGALQIILGLLIILAQIVVTALQADAYQGLVGFWAGTLIVVAGSFGVQSSKSKSTCTVVTTMVLSIIAACFCTGIISQGAVGAASASAVYECDYEDYPIFKSSCSYNWTPHAMAGLAFHSIMVILGLLEGIVAIVAAAYCCLGCCFHPKPAASENTIPLVLSPSGMTQFPMAPGEMPNPAAYYQAPLADVSPAAYSGGTTPPPEYSEKV